MTASLAEHFGRDSADRIARAVTSQGLWVTDADGTLWRDDIGEEFLKRLIADGRLVSPLARGIDVWAEYERRVAVNRATGYAFAVQVMEGIREDEVRRMTDAFASEFVGPHLLPEMSELIRVAAERGCETWIVSASNQWIVESAAVLLGIPRERVVGIRVSVRDGVLTADAADPITYAAGKVAAFASATPRIPTLVTGDSKGDLELMAAASDAMLVVYPSKTDPSLIALAQHLGWMVHAASPIATRG